jgi:tetratricopeptide (TPR) repeat protein
VQESGFFTSLERYGRKIVGRSPLPYSWIVILLVLLVVGVSWTSQSLVGVSSIGEAARQAAQAGDYNLAETLYLKQQTAGFTGQVLGMASDLEELIYPERKIERRISELEQKLETYPGSREIYLLLSKLYSQIGKQELANTYSEQARVLDPNGNQ